MSGSTTYHVLELLLDGKIEVVQWHGRFYLVATGTELPFPMLSYLGFTSAESEREAVEELQRIK